MRQLKVVKDNMLIENFIFNATEFELQILNYAVAITSPYWKNEAFVYKISIPELVKNYGSKNKDVYTRYRDALLRLQCRKYGYYIESEKYTENVITRVIENEKDTSYLEFTFNKYIADRIQNLKGLFTQYNIKNIVKFSSRYAFLLYEFFKMKLSQSNSGYHQKISVGDFRENLELKDKYKYFRDVRLYVLEVSKDQINTHSDINLDYQIIKTGRTPTHIKFTAKYKKGKQPQVEITTKALEAKPPIAEPVVVAVKSQPKMTDDHKKVAKPHLEALKKKVGI